MNAWDRLSSRYRQAKTKLSEILTEKPRGTVQQHEQRIIKKTGAELSALYSFTNDWLDHNISAIYEEDLNAGYDDIKRQYEDAGLIAPLFYIMWTQQDNAAIYQSRQNLGRYLEDAINKTSEYMRTETRRAAMQATRDAIYYGQRTEIMQANLIELLEKRGIESVSYLRNGKVCYMQLDTYAELCARTTETEIRNTANINLGYRINNDLVQISEHFGACPICTPYEGRVYSISGTNPYYPYLYDTAWDAAYQNFHPNCGHILTQYIEDFHTPEENQAMQEYSNRSFEIGGDGWTKEQTERAKKSLETYKQGQEIKRRAYETKKQYLKYKEVLGKNAPQSLSAFSRIKNNNGERYATIKAQYRAVTYNATPEDIANKDRTNYILNIKPTLPKVTYEYSAKLQGTIEINSKIVGGILPKGAEISEVRTFAGYRTSETFNKASYFAKTFGGEDYKWQHKGGIIYTKNFSYDVHWNEYNGKQYYYDVKIIKKL